METYTFQSLPADDNLNAYSYCIEIQDEMFIQKGKMIAYFGGIKFESLGAGMYAVLVKKTFNAPMYASRFVIASGRGKLILADDGNNIASYKLDASALTVKAAHVLGFTKSILCQESTLPGYLTLIGTGTFLASSRGPVHFLELPCRVDEHALLGWADCMSPSYRYDYSHVTSVLNAIGTTLGVGLTGDERQIDFTGTGTVLIQSSEEAMPGGTPALDEILRQVPGLQKTEIQSLSMILAQKLRGA